MTDVILRISGMDCGACARCGGCRGCAKYL